LPFRNDNSGAYQLRLFDARSLPMSREFLNQWLPADYPRSSANNPNEPQILFNWSPILDPAGPANFRLASRT